VVSAAREARPDTDIIFDLAARLGLAEQFGMLTSMPPTVTSSLRPASRWSNCVPPRRRTGAVANPSRQYAEPGPSGAPLGFATPSRKIELYSQTFLDHGYAPLPDFAEPQSAR